MSFNKHERGTWLKLSFVRDELQGYGFVMGI